MRPQRALVSFTAATVLLASSVTAQTTLSTTISPSTSAITNPAAAPASTSSTPTHSTSTSHSTPTSISHLTSLPPLPSTTPLPSASSSVIPISVPLTPPSPDDPYDPTAAQAQHSNLVNLYFFFLLLGGVLAAAVVWLVYRRKRRLAVAERENRREALARDLSAERIRFGPVDEGRWRDRRRWLVGFGGVRAGQEEQEAPPPPYKARDEEGRVGSAEGRKPPDYEEVERAGSGDTTSDETRRG